MGSQPFRVDQIAVAPEPLLDSSVHDEADSFEVRLDQPDIHSAEEWVRTALEDAPAGLRLLIRRVHRDVIRFRLGPQSDADHILGWQIVTSSPDVLQLEAAGPVARGVIVARRQSSTRATLTTFVFYRNSSARLMWPFIRPVHQRVARYLLHRAAATFTAPAVTSMH
jgi:hypothetical protein